MNGFEEKEVNFYARLYFNSIKSNLPFESKFDSWFDGPYGKISIIYKWGMPEKNGILHLDYINYRRDILISKLLS